MPSSIAKSLGLTLTTNYGKCYAMDGKKIPLIGQVKDAQVVLAPCLDKRLKLTILVVDIPPRYEILLSRKWSATMGGSL